MSWNHSIYLLRDPQTQLTKIGCSRHPLIRRQALSNRIGRTLKLVYTEEIGRDAFQFERDLHRVFKEQRRAGEWFEVTPAEVVKAIRSLLSTNLKYGSREARA